MAMALPLPSVHTFAVLVPDFTKISLKGMVNVCKLIAFVEMPLSVGP